MALPALRQRKEDIILSFFNQELETNKVISEKCLGLLTEYVCPGNIRQLENLMEKPVITRDNIIDYQALLNAILQNKNTHNH